MIITLAADLGLLAVISFVVHSCSLLIVTDAGLLRLLAVISFVVHSCS
jgi:hypothetical protein